MNYENKYKDKEQCVISMIGLGYIGLPTAATIAARGYKVKGVEINQHARDTINAGNIHIAEPELDVLVRSAVTGGYLEAISEPVEADVFVIAVPTPFKNNYEPDLKYVESASRALSKVLKRGDLVILESTSPVGTCRKMSQWIAEERPDLKLPHTHQDDADIMMSYCPERILPGQVIRELVENSRIVGGLTSASSAAAKAFYQIFVQGEITETTAETAELVKLTENSYRDVNIAFANELSQICDQDDIDVWEVIQLANKHPRVNILTPGPGVGGHCIAVDPWFIVHAAPQYANLIKQARITNDGKAVYVTENIVKLATEVSGDIAILGLAYKPDIDDLRESPAMNIVESLAEAGLGGRLRVIEPNIGGMPAKLADKGVKNFSGSVEALADVAIAVILVAHKEFREVDFSEFPNLKVVDTVGISH